MLINLYVVYLKDETMDVKKSKAMFNLLFRSLMLILEMLRSYSTPFAGYVSNILEAFVQLYYRQPFCFTSDPSHTSKGSLMIMSNDGPEEQHALSQIKSIVYLNGSASIEYLPIHHFLQAKKQYQLLFEYFYSSIDINSKPNEEADRRVLAISFFRDRIYDDFFWDIVKYLKIDILMLKLIDREELAMHLLLFYKDFTASANCQDFALVYSNVFYLKLGVILMKSLIPIELKSTVIEIASNILRLQDAKLIKKMNEPAFGLLR